MNLDFVVVAASIESHNGYLFYLFIMLNEFFFLFRIFLMLNDYPVCLNVIEIIN